MASTSLVLELQREAIESETDICRLLRKAYLVAVKLKLDEFRKWIEQELDGYAHKNDAPLYRHVRATFQVLDRYHGWQPVFVAKSTLRNALTNAVLTEPIGRLQALLTNQAGEGLLTLPLPEDFAQEMMEVMQSDDRPTRILELASIGSVFDAVRNRILEWSLRLEQEGILGEGMTFSSEEQAKAQAAASIINIQHFNGVFGDVSAQQLQIGNYCAIETQLGELGVADADRQELKKIVDDLNRAEGEARQPVLMRGLDWVMKHSMQIGILADHIRRWFQPA